MKQGWKIGETFTSPQLESGMSKVQVSMPGEGRGRYVCRVSYM
jgi:hypothetical protein